MRIPLMIAALATTLAPDVLADDAAMQPHPFEECLEGGEFIRNAALSRDNGITREFFMSRLADDLQAIKSFPPQLRWFVRNELDEILLTEAVARVFDAPQPATRHEIDFVDACMQSPLWRLERVQNENAPQHVVSAMR